MTADINQVIDEQKRYYQARAAEYDEWFYRKGRYDFGPEETRRWEREAAEVRQRLYAHNLAGRVLEIAAGTGIWTQELLKTAASVLAVDASSEVLAINRAKLQSERVTYVVSDIFAWQPAQRFDGVFMGFWLSHVPPSRLADFLAAVANWLKPGGKLFIVDSLPKPTSTAKDMVDDVVRHRDRSRKPDDAQTLMNRRLNDGRNFQIVKVYYDPHDLRTYFDRQGLAVEVSGTDNFFLFGAGVKN